MRLAPLGATFLLLTALAPAPVRAQNEASAGETAVARRLFREGIEASRAGDFAAAADAFRRSYELSERPVTLLNLAGALAQTRFLVEAAERYRRYLRMTRDDGDPRRRDAAQQALDALLPRIPHVVIRVEGLAASDALRLDDETLAHAVVGERLPVDPDLHRVSVWRDEIEIAAEDLAMTEGQEREVVLDVRSAAPPRRSVPTPRETAEGATGAIGGGTSSAGGGGEAGPRRRRGDDEEGGGVFASPVFWIVAGLLVAGGGVGAYFFFTRETAPDPFVGNVVPGRLVLD